MEFFIKPLNYNTINSNNGSAYTLVKNTLRICLSLILQVSPEDPSCD